MNNQSFRNSMQAGVDPSTAVAMSANNLTENGVNFKRLPRGEQDLKILETQQTLDNIFNEIAEKLQIEPDNLTAEKIHQLSSQIAADESISTSIAIYKHVYRELAEYRHITEYPGYESDNPFDWPKSPFDSAIDLSFAKDGQEPGDN